MASDSKTIELIKQGDIDAFNTLFKSVYLQLYIHCRKFIPYPEEAKDILQNVFLRFWEKREEIDIHTSLNAYLYKAIQNECLNYLRSTRTIDILQSEDLELNKYEVVEEGDPYSDLNVLEIEQITENTIEELPNQCKSIFKLSRINGLKNQEIADKLDISVRTVETQIYRALKTLKSKLKDYLAS
ncbi:MAG: RNA polymerase sigma-70 factor [Parabacteroides sp.]|nr:RNA polymerase sigma-70 factor [Parabacteroides sp.]